MCNPSESESGQLLTIQPCGWYLKLQSDRDRLAGVVKGMEEQNARLSAREDELNALCLDYQIDLDAARQENDALRQEAVDWRSAKALAESKETAVHLALNDMRAERDALLKVLESLEWVEIYGPAARHCPSCGRSDMSGHDEHCMLAKAIKEARDG